MAFEDALIKREVVEQTERRIVIHETWNLRHPDCPFVVLNMAGDTAPKGEPHHVEEYWLTPEEYKRNFGKRP